MSRCIDADALKSKCGDWYVEEGPEEGFIGTIGQLLDGQPTVEPERKTGKWICSDDLYETAVCSCCGWDTTEPWQHIKSWFEFCPHCGADMRGEQDD